MKVLHILSTSKWTGPATYVVDIVESLINKGDDSLLIIRTKPRGNLKEILKQKNIPFSEKLFLYKKFNPIYLLNDIYCLKKIVSQFSPNIIHTHFSPENFLTLFLNKKYKIVRSIHNTKATKKRFLSPLILNKNDYIHTVCEEYKKNLIINNKIPEKKIKIIHGWIDENRFTPKGKKFKLLENNNKIKVGMVARFQKHRGHNYLVKALKKLNRKDVVLILTGRGENKIVIENMVKDLNLIDQVIFTGYIKEELPDLLRTLDIFVLLEEGSDGTCRAILEAMASGLPIISVNKGAIKETVIDGNNGFLIDTKENISLLAEKIKILIENENLRKKFGENSRKIIEEKFTKTKQLEKFYNFYREIL